MPSWIQGAIRRPVIDRFGVQGLAGLADVQCDSEGCYETSTGAIVSSTPTGTQVSGNVACDSQGCYNITTGAVLTGSSAGSGASPSATDWTSLLNTLAKSGTTLAAESMLSPGVSVSPTGAVSQQAAGYPIGTGVATAISGISSTTLLMIAGLAVLVLFAGGRR